MFDEAKVHNISKYITKDTTLVIDSDGIAFKPAAMLDETFITAVNKQSGASNEFKNITEFKGNVRKEGAIAPTSWLGTLNAKMSASGKDTYKLTDYEIIKGRKPKPYLTFEKMTENVDDHIEAIKEQTKCSKVILLLGSGECHRHGVELPEMYKGNRDRDDTPLRLRDMREHLMSKPEVEVVTGIEADDKCSIYAWNGYLSYRKTGKFDYIVSSNDKDALQSAGLLFNWDRNTGEFKHKEPWIIKPFSESVGGVDLVKGEIKAYGLMQIINQILRGDSSDNYHSFKNVNTDYSVGDAELYRKLFGVTEQQEALQTLVDCYKEAFPEKIVKFTSYSGEVVETNYIDWMERQFKLVYMLRSENDPLTITKLLDHYKVDY